MKKPHKEKNKKSLQQNDLNNRSETETDTSAQVSPTSAINFARGYKRGIGPRKRATKVGWGTSEDLISEILSISNKGLVGLNDKTLVDSSIEEGPTIKPSQQNQQKKTRDEKQSTEKKMLCSDNRFNVLQSLPDDSP